MLFAPHIPSIVHASTEKQIPLISSPCVCVCVCAHGGGFLEAWLGYPLAFVMKYIRGVIDLFCEQVYNAIILQNLPAQEVEMRGIMLYVGLGHRCRCCWFNAGVLWWCKVVHPCLVIPPSFYACVCVFSVTKQLWRLSLAMHTF